MTEDEVETHISIDSASADGTLDVIHFQEYWIRLRASVPVRAVEFRGAASATAGPGVIEAILGADRVILPPSNPIVSTGAILAINQIAQAVRETAAPVVGVSPIIGGAAVRGMADQLLTGLGLDISASGVARHLGARRDGGVLDGWLVDTADTGELAAVEGLGVAGRSVPLYMTDDETTAQLARETLALAAELAS
jgi:LPPG:FO 2-phospho-L-lactate transferase